MRWLAVVALACGCGDNIAGTELVDYDLAEFRARCAYLTRCGLFTEQAACEAYLRPRLDESRVDAVRNEQMRYDAAAAKKCLEELTEMTCDQASREVRVKSEACRRAFRGDLNGGEECAFDAECESGDCDVEACQVETCCFGTCTVEMEPAGIDEPCMVTADCIDDAWCGVDQKCHALVGVAGPCDLDEQCDYGLGCIGATEFMPGACRALPFLGEACPYKRCAELGATCVKGTCVPVGLPGDPCEETADCSEYARCNTLSGICEATETLGMPCNVFCAGESWCDFAETQMCRELKENTTPCMLDVQCASGYCAEGVFYKYCADRPVCY